MQTISSTEFNRRPARYFRQAEKRPICVQFRGRRRCLLVPQDFSGENPLADLHFDNLPKTARHSRQDIVDWLIVGELDRLWRKHPGPTKKAMRHNLLRYREVGSMRDDLIEIWEELLDAGPEAILAALSQDNDRGSQLRQLAPVSGLFGLADRERILDAANRLLAEKYAAETKGRPHK